ncbi:DUF1634 domain-containing protein [Pedobacter faecalis]|uniref:DUF1634 domain-containing protein n=1 Tax=Pedobacter faecalis TaxID=3041495 RepID=UPI00254B5CF6|nr:DUF1634 domain-containing protein [Pedobacter sp. ELA7]
MMNKDKGDLKSEKDIQLILGTLLRVGVMSSMIIVLIGACIYLFDHSAERIDYGSFNPDKSGLSSVSAILYGLLRLDGSSVIQFGVLLLIFTPVMRVVFSVFSFLIERDYLYVAIGFFVLCVILFSLSNNLVG